MKSVMDELPSRIDWSREPTLADVLTLKRHLLRTLPVELVDIIVSFAEYWPRKSTLYAGPPLVQEQNRDPSPNPQLTDLNFSNTLLVQSAPLALSQPMSHPLLSPKTQHPARKLVVEFTARYAAGERKAYRPPLAIGFTIEIANRDNRAQQPRSLPPSKNEQNEQDALLSPRDSNGGESSASNSPCTTGDRPGFKQRMSLYTGFLKWRYDVDGLLEYRSVMVVYRFDDRDIKAASSIKPGEKFLGSQRTNGADLIRSLQVGDQISVWARRVKYGPPVAAVEAVRVTIFWEV